MKITEIKLSRKEINKILRWFWLTHTKGEKYWDDIIDNDVINESERTDREDPPLLPEFLQAGHTQDVEVEADPGEGEDEAQPAQDQTIELDDPSEGGKARTVEFEDETLLPLTSRGREVIKVLLSFITEGREGIF